MPAIYRTYWYVRDRLWLAVSLISSYYGWMLLGFLLLWGIALGGGIWGQSGDWGQQWQHLLFGEICHQIPARSFWIGGQPMAVCARCFGIYTALLSGWLAIPQLRVLKDLVRKNSLQFSLFAIGLNLVDVAGEFFHLWQNTLFGRGFLGMMLGISAVAILISNLK